MINIAFFDGVRSTEPANMELSWDNLCNLMQEASHEPWKRADKLKRMAFVAGMVELCGYPETLSQIALFNIWLRRVCRDIWTVPTTKRRSRDND